jgi:hypothetical protein
MSDHETPSEGDLTTSTGETPAPTPRRSIGRIISELWNQKPGTRAPREPKFHGSSKEIVDGLDRTEQILGGAAVAFAIALALIGFFYSRHSSTKSIHDAANFLLVSNLVFAGILAFGLIIRRRALLGFGAFFFGLELAFSLRALPYGLPFIAFGGWLIVRANRKQQLTRSAADPGSLRNSRSSSRSAATGLPKASKRYTPPRRARGAKR